MALLSQKASWRRADPAVARFDDVGATATSSGASILLPDVSEGYTHLRRYA